MSKSIYKKVGIATLIMMASVFLSRVIGLVREMVIAGFCGAKGEVDAYQIAFVIPEILNHLVACGFLSVTFIPIFSNYITKDQEKQAWHVFSNILTVFGTLLIVFIIFGMIFAPQIVQIIAPGLTNPELKSNAIKMTRIILPAQFFFFAGGLFMAVQFAKERFAIPALAPLIYNLGIIIGGIFLYPILGIQGFSWGVLAGAFIGSFGVQLFGARKIGMKYFPAIDFKDPELKKYIFLTLPLMLGLTMTFSTEFFLKFFGSYLPSGNIAALNYGLRIMFVVVGVVGQGLGVASFPFMARLASENKLEQMNELLNNSLKYLALVIPVSVLIMVLRHEVVVILFQRGEFDLAASELCSNILLFLMTGAFAFAAQTVVVRGFYAVQNTMFPAIFGTIAVLLSIPLYIIGLNTMGVSGIALAVSLSAVLQVTILYVIWNKKAKNISHKVYTFYIKMILLSLFTGFVLQTFKTAFLSDFDTNNFTGSLIVVCFIGVLFIFILAGAGYIFKIKEITESINRVLVRYRFTGQP